MAIVKPNLHGLNRLRCFCWDPTRPEMNRVLCTGYIGSRASVIRHHTTEGGKHDDRPQLADFGNYRNIDVPFHLVVRSLQFIKINLKQISNIYGPVCHIYWDHLAQMH